MKLENVAGFSSIDEYVEYKTNLFSQQEKTYHNLFVLMFSEKHNIFWEENDGYHIIKHTYEEVYERILYKSSFLKERLKTYEHNSIIGLYMLNSLDWIENFWAILRCGYRPLLLNCNMGISLLNEKVIKEFNCVAVISDKEQFFVDTILNEEINSSKCEDVCDNEFGDSIFVMSSGTTENIKICAYGALQMYHQIINAKEIVKNSTLIKKHYQGELKQLTFLPFYHIFGLSAMYMWFAFYARTFVYLKDLSSQTILNTIRRHKVTHIFAVPLFWNKVYEAAIKKIKERGQKTYNKFQKGLKLSNKLGGAIGRFFRKKAFKEVRENLFGESISFMITGGGIISKEVLSFFNGIGYHLSNGYGMSEIGITSVELSENNEVLNSGSIGIPMNSVSYMINENKELLVKGQSLCNYYFSKNETVYNEGDWFNTKDIAEEVNGRFYLLGRIDDLIVSSSGENINPNLVEQYFDLPLVKRVCLISISNQVAHNLEIVLLVEVNKHISKNKLKEINDEIKNILQKINLASEVSKICFVGQSLILDNEFKLNRIRLSKDYSLGELSVIDQEIKENIAYKDELEEILVSIFAKILNKSLSEIKIDDDFFLDLNGNSLDYFTLISEIQDEFDIIISLSNSERITTVKEFYTYIKERM